MNDGLPPVSLVCCGLIGVSVNDGGMVERAFAEACATQGIVPGTAAYAHCMVAVHQSRGQAPVDVFRALFPDGKGRAEAAAMSFERSLRGALDRTGVTPAPGAEEGLDRLREAGIRVCMVTGLSRKLLGMILDTLGWWRKVDAALSPDDVPRGFPWPDLTLTAMLRLGVDDVRAAAFAASTSSGVLCGKRSGANVVAGVLTGEHTRDRLHGAGATHVIPTLADLPGLLDGRGAAAVTAAGEPGAGKDEPAGPDTPGAGKPEGREGKRSGRAVRGRSAGLSTR